MRVDVQAHFNDIALRLRSAAIGLLVAVVGASGYAVVANQWPLALTVLFVGGLGWRAFHMMDRYWYHVFLRAAGIHAGKIEDELKPIIPRMGSQSTDYRG
jgi:hypothetical protein